MALLILICATCLDIKNGGSSTIMLAIPFIVILITGKQYVDKEKAKNGLLK